ncbi:MAG: beta-eliminating lyase-related protein [Wenzhouxiangellaceae bacterium]|nr:beta-eliminating lyase-related protein [Wenzhouxiangellaceae bacterium]
MNFRSDNEAPAHPRLLEALVAANAGTATAYAEDDWSLALDTAFSERFGRECRVLPLATGTAANSITLAAMTPPWGTVLCHRRAHIANDEGGAPMFYMHGATLTLLDGSDGRLQPEPLAAAIDAAGAHGVHNLKPAAVSITQASECGTCYRPDQVRALAEVAHARGLALHMDGARFANAVAWLACEPAALTWQAGVDALSFGATKNGAMAAEAIVVFGHPEWLEPLERMRKRGGHLLSKMRYVSAQLLAMLEDDLWLTLARDANAAAARLAAAIEASPVASLYWPVEANEVFMQAPPARLAELHAAGFAFHIWPGHDGLARLVCSYATADADVDRLADAIAQWT